MRILAPGFVTVLLFPLVFASSYYFFPVVVLNDPALYPLKVGLASWNDQASAGGGAQDGFALVITGALVGVVPIVVGFLCLQRFWQDGLTFGSLK